jgi:hypothetical protein
MKERYNIRPETVERFDTRTRCDRCGVEIERTRGERDETTIEHGHGYSYPEGGSMEYDFVDCCSTCWPEARAALEAIGFTFGKREVDW